MLFTSGKKERKKERNKQFTFDVDAIEAHPSGTCSISRIYNQT
jgi:hypothetical protein